MKRDYNRLTTCILLAVVLGLMVSVEAARDPNEHAVAETEPEPAVAETKPEPAVAETEPEPAVAETEPEPALRPAGWAVYKVIVERNMFSRQRGARTRRSDDREMRAPPPAPNPESYYLLKGIVQEGDAFIAFLEDTRGGQILRVRKGDSVARGVIKALGLDSIEYQLEDRTITVTMGYDLECGQGAITMAQLYEFSQTSPTAPQEGATSAPGESSPSGDDAEILRQLMERRKQQLGQ
jgi:hypothetical protein